MRGPTPPNLKKMRLEGAYTGTTKASLDLHGVKRHSEEYDEDALSSNLGGKGPGKSTTDDPRTTAIEPDHHFDIWTEEVHGLPSQSRAHS